MQLNNQSRFKENVKQYNYLKQNSYYFKSLNRGIIDYDKFVSEMKIKYKERTTDKISNAIDNMDLISSVLDILKWKICWLLLVFIVLFNHRGACLNEKNNEK